MDVFGPGDRIAVIAPHPDDEALGVGGLLFQAHEQGLPVSVIYLTSGDGNRVGTMQWSKRPLPRPHHFTAYARMREQEAVRSLGALGLDAQDACFLGFPDQGLKKLLQPKYQTRPYRSKYTKADRTLTGTPYSGTAVTARLHDVLAEIKPTVLLLPMLEDSHTDHLAAGKLGRKVARKLDAPPRTYAYPVHYRLFPKPRGIDPSLPLEAPKRHPRAAEWISVELAPEAVAAKSAAVERYASQLKIPLLDTLMRSLVRRNELLLPLP